LETEGIIGEQFEHGAVAFFDLQAGLKLALWPRRSLAHDSGIALAKGSATEFTLGHNVTSKAEVDAVMKQAQDAGATLVKPAQDTFWGGYAGYFQDPDRHLWEIAWNPQLLPKDEA
jgi:catechol 2,3-dioxygenase-like lactoylglutathione lyase family enzyme